MSHTDPSQDRPQFTKKNNKRRSKKHLDGAVDLIEIISEEVGGIGLAKRVHQKIKAYFAREYIRRIQLLEVRQEELLETNAVLTRLGQDCIERIDALQEERRRLKAEVSLLKGHTIN